MSRSRTNTEGFIDRFAKVGPKRAAIFTHRSPDPDALGSAMALTWFLNKQFPDVEVVSFYSGSISHPQNMAMMNLLETGMRPVEEFDPKLFEFLILVDTQ